MIGNFRRQMVRHLMITALPAIYMKCLLGQRYISC
jgi:hypothetical protein